MNEKKRENNWHMDFGGNYVVYILSIQPLCGRNRENSNRKNGGIFLM